MSNVPLPCPFCGGAPNQQTDRVYWPKFRVFCDHGAEHAVFIGGDTQEAAIAAWNRRAHAAKDDEIERLRAEVAGLREDAERYRWIRDNPWPPILEVDIVLHRNARWDAAIDVARKQKP